MPSGLIILIKIEKQGLIGKNFVSIDPGGSGTVLQPGETITETESLIDFAALVGKYAFDNPINNDPRNVNLALKKIQ